MAIKDTDAGARPEPTPYDFGRPTKLAREHARLLEMVYETVARQWATVLSSELGVTCKVVLGGVDVRSYDDYMSKLETPNLLAVFAASPHPGAAFLQMPVEAGFHAIERMLGGTGTEQPHRVTTEIETQLILTLIERLLSELRYPLAAVTDLSATLRSLELNPQFVQVAAATDLYIVTELAVSIDGGEPMLATVAMPAAVLAMPSSEAGIDAAGLRERERSRATMNSLVADVAVDVVVRFVPRAMPSQQLLQLRVGDVVHLGHPVDRPLDVVSAGVVFAQGAPGTHGVKAACLVTSSSINAATMATATFGRVFA